MTAPSRCEPAAEHAHLKFHWLRWKDMSPEVVTWWGNAWHMPLDQNGYAPDEVHGWRYVAPCLPPRAESGEDGRG